MIRRLAPLALSAAVLLGACARPDVAPTTGGTAPTAAAPTAIGGFPGGGPGGVPTVGAQPSTTPIPERPRPTYTVQRGDVVSVLEATGRVVQVQQQLSFQQDGIVSQVFVERGAPIEPGQLLAELELDELNDQLQQARTNYEQDKVAADRAIEAANIEVRNAEIDLATARDNLATSKEPAKPDVLARARATLATAQADLATTRNTSSEAKNQALREMTLAARELEVAQARLREEEERYDDDKRDSQRAALQSAQDTVRRAESDLLRTQIAYETARGNEVAAVQRAEASVEAARADLDALLRLPDPALVAEASRNVARAETRLDAARQRAQPDPSQTKTLTAGLGEIQRIERMIDERRLYAPSGGQVGFSEIRKGVNVRAGEPVMGIFDTSTFEIAAEIDLSADGRLATDIVVGQPVQVTFARFPDKAVTGEISRLPGQSSDFSPSTSSTYAISFNAEGLQIKVGEPATLKIELGRSESTLWLPVEAVRYNRGQPFVVIKFGEEERRVDVTVGLITSDRVEIVAGLGENDVVLGENTR